MKIKKSQLKSIIETIVKEAIINKLMEQPVGGVKDDRPFNAGRNSVMKAVNVAEEIGFDGKYVDDMESGVAVKKLHNLDEESATGAVAGYSTPYAFSKKSGSKRALDATTKMGYKKVKDISEETK